MAEGIIFGGFLLAEQDFKIIFKEWYEQRGQEFKQRLQTDIIDQLNKMIQIGQRVNTQGKIVNTTRRIKGQYDAFKIYTAWENLTKEYFGNGSVSLLAGVKINGKEYTWTNLIEEKELITQSGINVTSKGLQKLQETLDNIDSIYAANEIENFLNQHYDDLLKTLSSYTLSKEEARSLHILLAYRNSKLNKRDIHFTNSTYNNIIFKTQQNAEGKRLDAFINHVGQYNPQLFNLMKVGRTNSSLLNSLSIKYHESFNEMFSSKSNEIQTLFINSLNSTSWLTGGDIIIVDEKTGAVIHNIQLKTTGKGKIFDVTSTLLLNLANQLISYIESDSKTVDDLADLLYNKLKTTSTNDFERAENFLETEAYQMVKDNLKIK